MFPIADSVPRRYPPVCVWTLIALNALVFLFQGTLSASEAGAFVIRFALIPARYGDPAWAMAQGLDPGDYLPFLSNMFLHGGWFHILANMWTLWLFGPSVEDRMGSLPFAAFYLACGLFAGVTHVALHPLSTVPALGASGAIAGVLGAYTVLFPLARIIILVPILFLPLFFELYAVVFTVIWFAMQLLQGVRELALPTFAGGIAWWAHVGGFLAGVVLILLRRLAPPRYRARFRDETAYGFGVRGERR